MQIKDCLCIASSPERPSEDAIGHSEKYCFVLDGASSLTGFNYVDELSDSQWMSSVIAKGLCDALDTNPCADIKSTLESILTGLKDTYNRAFEEKNTEGLSLPEDTPSCGMALFRECNGNLEFYGIGDCVGTVMKKDGSFFSFCDDELTNLDGSVLDEMKQIHEETGVNTIDVRHQFDKVKRHLIDNRLMRNKKGGYGVLDLFSTDYDLMTVWKCPLEEISSICSFSDGFASLSDCFNVYNSYEELHAAMLCRSLESMYEDLFKIQNSDPFGNAYPRFKLRDDTSAVVSLI